MGSSSFTEVGMRSVDKKEVLSLIQKHCEGLQVTSINDLVHCDEYKDVYFYNAVHVLSEILVKLEVLSVEDLEE